MIQDFDSICVRPVGAGESSDFDCDVVQQPGLSEPGGDQQPAGSIGRRGTQPGVAQLQVVDADRGHGVEHGTRRGERGLRTGRRGVHPGQQRRRERRGQFALHRIQVAVARRHRQPIRFPHGGHPDHVDTNVEVGHHLPDHRQLLIVLLAEEDPVGAHDLQQLEHDRQHAGEMGGPGRALEFGGQRTRLHRGAQTVGIHRRGRRGEHDLDTFVAQQRQVVIEGPRVGVEIFAGTELQRVDEDRHHDHRAGHSFGGTHQRQVPVVQRAHGRHQHHPPAGVPQRAADIGDIARGRVQVEFAGSEGGRFCRGLRACRGRRGHCASTSTTSAGACARRAVRSAFTR